MIESWVMKKILRAFENKDIATINSLVVNQNIHPNDVIPTKGVTLLHLIIGHQSEAFAFRVAKLFMRCGGDPNIQSSDGVTPIHVAAAWGRTRILHLLLVNGGDPWMQDDEKKNAFNYAFEEREWDAIEMLHHFQQMHSAANSRDVDLYPRFQLHLERVLLRKGEDMFAYAPVKKATKSMTTQTEENESGSSPPSPVQNKIKFFESETQGDEVNLWKKPEKNVGWVKDFYQTSCEVVVHCDASKETEQKKETYVSSIHIDTSPLRSDSGVEKSAENSSLDVRGQLFLELQEAVRRRSKLKMVQPERDLASNDAENSVILLNNTENDSLAKEVSYLYGANSKGKGMLRNMSDFATKVMEEAADAGPDDTVDLFGSSPEISNAYLSCPDDPEPRQSHLQQTKSFLTPLNDSDTSNLYLTPYNSNLSNDSAPMNKSKEINSNESFMSVSEEYKYTDAQEGVVLLEKKLLVTPTISFALEDEGNVDDNQSNCEDFSNVSSTASASSVPSSISYNSDVLRCDLKALGYNPGPVTKTTKKLYLKKLWKLRKKAKRTRTPEKENLADEPVYSPVLEKTTTNPHYFEKISGYRCLEEDMCRSFENWTKRKWREGTNKTSFNYLLLDSRISLNLPKRAPGMTAFETWKCFLSAIFYVGKGKRSRPYAHLYRAAALWEKRASLDRDEKTRRIIEIWKEGMGVVCLQVFQNIIPVEAFTREAAMIDALGLSTLKNARTGEYYGIASTWSTREKIHLGTYLLHKSMHIFLNEGERQIKPYDID